MSLPPGRQYAISGFVSRHSISSPEAVSSVGERTATCEAIADAIHAGHSLHRQGAGGRPHGRQTLLHRGGAGPSTACGPTHAGRDGSLGSKPSLGRLCGPINPAAWLETASACACLASRRAWDRSFLRALADFPSRTYCSRGSVGAALPEAADPAEAALPEAAEPAEAALGWKPGPAESGEASLLEKARIKHVQMTPPLTRGSSSSLAHV